MVACSEHPEEFAHALSMHHTFTVRVVLAAPAFGVQVLPSIQERLIREKKQWFQASLAQVLKAVIQVTENCEGAKALECYLDSNTHEAESMASDSLLSEENPYGELPNIFDVLEECSVGLADKATDVRSFIHNRYGKPLGKTLLAQLHEGVRASSVGGKRRVYLNGGRGLRIKEQAA